MRPTLIKLSCFCLVPVAPAGFPSEHDWPASEGPPPSWGPGFGGVSFTANMAPLTPPSLSLDCGCEKKEKKSRFVWLLF